MNQQIFEYKLINHFTAEHLCYFYFKVHKNVNTQPILSMLQTCAFLPHFQKAYYYYYFFFFTWIARNGPSCSLA